MGWFHVAVMVRHVDVTTEVMTVAADDLEHAKQRAVQLLERNGPVELLDIRAERAANR